MRHEAKLYPGGDINFTIVRPWISVTHDEEYGNELWIDLANFYRVDFDLACWQDIDNVVFFDYLHAPSHLPKIHKEQIQLVAQRYPTRWITSNKLPVPGFDTEHFDFLWNRTRRAYLEHEPGWKHCSVPEVYVQYPLNWNPRSHCYLNLNNSVNDYRARLKQFLSQFPGYVSDVKQGQIIGNSLVKDHHLQGIAIPPDQTYFDTSYVSCQVESQYLGSESVMFTEKTYDHLIQGRIVLNFGPAGFYRALAADGWQLPQGVDLEWDLEINDAHRFQGYLDCLNSLFKMNSHDLHDWFLSNRSVIEHNYQMLNTKPYDKLD